MKTNDFKKISCAFLLALGMAGLARAADVYTHDELRAAVEGASGDQTVNLLADITISSDEPIAVTRSVTLRSGGFDTFVIRSSVENATQPLFKVASSGQLAFHGVVLDGENRERQECAVEVLPGGRLYVESSNTEIRNFRTHDTRANAIFCGGYMEMRPGAVVSNCTSVVCQREYLEFPIDSNVPAAIVIDNNATLALNGGLVTGCTDGGISCRANGAVKVLGAPVVWGNTQCGQCCDLCIINPSNSLILDGYFTGKIGVYICENYPMPDGTIFGLNQRDNKGAQNFHFNGFGGRDVDGDYVGRQGFVGATENRRLVWTYPVCRVGTDYYATLAEGINAAQPGDTVELLRNVTLDTKITLAKSLTLASPIQSAYEEGGARTLLRTNDVSGVITVQDGVSLTLRDIVIADSDYISSPWLTLENGSTLNMLSGSVASNVAHAVKVNTATLNLAGGQTKDGASVESGYLATLEGNNAQLNVSGDSKGMVWVSRQSKLTLVGDLTGWIKAETVARPVQGTVFGSVAGNFKGAERIFSAVVDDFVGFRDGSDLVWLNTRTLPVCKIGDKEYHLFSNALEEARPGDTITLVGEIPLDRMYKIPCDLTITASEYYRWKFKRTGREGQLYVPAGKTLTLANVELDGANYANTSLPLIQVASGGTLVVGDGTLIQRCRTFSSLGCAISCQGTLALEGGVITGNAGRGAMGPVSASGTVCLSGDVRVTGNTGTGLSLPRADQLSIVGPFTGAVELGYPLSPVEGSAFGVVGDYEPTVNEVRRIVYRGDMETDFIAASDGEKLYWTANIVSAESGDDLGDAIADGGAGTGPRVIEIGADFSAGTVVIPAGDDVIIDLRGNTLTADIVARGNLTIIDSSEGQTGRVIGSLAEEGSGSLTLGAGAYSAALDPDWIAEGRIVLGNYDGSHQVLAETAPSEVHGVTLDTRRGVRVVDSPELDVLPLTYSSGHWVFGESDDGADTSWVAVADAQGPDPYTNALWHAGMEDNVAARGDKSYDYPSGNSNIVCSAQWLQVYDGPWEHEEVWLQDRVGLVEAVHSNRYGVIRAWYKYPEPTYQLVVKYQYEDGTSAMNDYTDALQEGDSYAVDSPAILGYRADIVVVEGTMPGEDVTVVVTYTPLPEGDRLVTVPDPVEKVYDGIPTNIAVTVAKSTAPDTPLASGEYTIKYSLYPDDPESWTNDLSFLDVGVSNKVYYVVEAEGFDPVTNFEYVTIWPREIVVTADDKTKVAGEDDPVLTWTVTDGTNAVGETVGILPGEADLVLAAVSNVVRHVIFREGAGTEAGEAPTPPDGSGHPIVIGGSDYIGNYHVTYVPGKLIIPAIFTSNIHGLLKIESPFANTIIPAPWKGYTRDGSPTNDIRVDRLVKPRNLTDGDMILQYSNGGVYKAWTLERTNGVEGVWTPMGTVAQTPVVGGATNVVASLHVAPTGEETQKRGYGMWLVRQRPVDEEDRPIPFYLYGQWMTGVETVTIGGVDENDVAIKYEGAQYDVVHDTMLADPDCKRASVINHHTWAGFDTADTIILNTDLKQSLYCFRRERPNRSGGGYYDGWWMWGEDGYTTNNISTPPGVGFWYERRAAGDMELTWEGPDRYPGEGRDLDVWIVDHADGGDGRTHLAVKFVGKYAPATITTNYISELFHSGSIRYLHATGETQADGKAEMDRLSQNLKDNALVVPALRNGTGVNTPDELAKGWIWVTVDVPDGTAAKSSQDGTGDTNGAGDLWRIVVGRGVWPTP